MLFSNAMIFLFKGLYISFPAHQVENRVCVTTHDGVYLLIVNAFPKEKAGKEYKLTCKLNQGFMSCL